MIFVDPAATNARLCLKLAGRLNTALKQELGDGIDVHRMVDEPLYARDVLLVCDALRDHAAGGTSALAQQFRQAARGVAIGAAAAAAAGAPGARDSNHGFSASRFLSSIFGPTSTRDTGHERAAKPRANPPHTWFGR